MADSRPLVSIGMPVYNGERFIRQALDSLLAQDYGNFELIVSDNASTDRTQDICLEYASNDSRIRYYHNVVNLGAANNFNRLVGLSFGKYFAFAADHDLWQSTFITRCTEVLEKEASVVLCYSRTMLIDSDGNSLGLTPDRIDTRRMSSVERYTHIIWNLDWCNMVYGVIRADQLRKIRGFKPMLGADHAVLAELALQGEFAQIPEPLFYRRKNRRDEDPETYKRRVIGYLDPRNSWKSQEKSFSQLYRQLALEHLRVVLRAPIMSRQKIRLLSETLSCFSVRWNILLPSFLPNRQISRFLCLLRNLTGRKRSSY